MNNLNIRPSSLPALVNCYQFASNRDLGLSINENKDNGTLQHKLLASILNGKEDKTICLPSADYENVHRAAKKVRSFIRAYCHDGEIKTELEIISSNGRGFVDVLAHNSQTLVVLDYKSHDSLKDFFPQVAWYASAFCEEENLNFKKIIIGCIYGSTRLNVRSFTQKQLKDYITSTLRCVTQNVKNKVMTASAFCDYCEHAGNCKVSVGEIEKIEDTFSNDSIATEDVAEKLDKSSDVEKRIKELKAYAKSCLEKGEEIVNATRSYGYKLQEITIFGIDFLAAYNYFLSLDNEELLEDLFNAISIPKVAIEELLQKALPFDPKERSKVLKSLLGEGQTSSRIKRYYLS